MARQPKDGGDGSYRSCATEDDFLISWKVEADGTTLIRLGAELEYEGAGLHVDHDLDLAQAEQLVQALQSVIGQVKERLKERQDGLSGGGSIAPEAAAAPAETDRRSLASDRVIIGEHLSLRPLINPDPRGRSGRIRDDLLCVLCMEARIGGRSYLVSCPLPLKIFAREVMVWQKIIVGAVDFLTHKEPEGTEDPLADLDCEDVQ